MTNGPSWRPRGGPFVTDYPEEGEISEPVGGVHGLAVGHHREVEVAGGGPAGVADVPDDLAALDLWVWPIATTPNCPDGPRMAFQIRRRMVEARRGAWDCAADWSAVWISFGESWYRGAEPLPWSAHAALWDKLGEYADHVRYRLGLGGVPLFEGAVGQLRDVRGRPERHEVVPQVQPRMDDLDLGHDLERPALRQGQSKLRERLEAAADA